MLNHPQYLRMVHCAPNQRRVNESSDQKQVSPKEISLPILIFPIARITKVMTFSTVSCFIPWSSHITIQLNYFHCSFNLHSTEVIMNIAEQCNNKLIQEKKHSYFVVVTGILVMKNTHSVFWKPSTASCLLPPTSWPQFTHLSVTQGLPHYKQSWPQIILVTSKLHYKKNDI